MTAIDVPPPHEGGQSDAEDVATLQKQATGSLMEQREQREGAQGARSLLQVERRPVELRDNETIQGDKFFSLSDHSSWSSNEQLDLEADKTSSEFESEVSSLALGKELQESGRSATVRKKQRKRSEQVGPNKHSTNPLDTKGLQGLQWEYSKDDLTLFDNGEKQPNPVSLETIYQSIMEHREESKLESRRTQMACRKMQIQIRRVAKTCSEFTTRMEEAETRISRLEDEAGARQSSREMMEKQLEDTHFAFLQLVFQAPNSNPPSTYAFNKGVRSKGVSINPEVVFRYLILQKGAEIECCLSHVADPVDICRSLSDMCKSVAQALISNKPGKDNFNQSWFNQEWAIAYKALKKAKNTVPCDHNIVMQARQAYKQSFEDLKAKIRAMAWENLEAAAL
ncbi:hypothetical protein NDU88_002879 [Pleurodeles waltl]|uniref:Uncharacterized protein n=1 Tax=Pleurodeles waltl TaxID=8319 RepID=A0AAV7V021_PLEWA|nr:hypothetical protein NDU88_002879 [Pleurodeles waltl]